jgi:hypothetical protein
LEEQICDPARSPGMVPFRQRGFVLPNAAMPARPNRSRVLDRTPHCYLLLFSLFFIVICAAGDAGRTAQAARRKAKSPLRADAALLFHCY